MFVGKSFTMIGSADISTCLKDTGEFDESAGITPRAVSEIFRLISERQAQVAFILLSIHYALSDIILWWLVGARQWLL